MKEKYYSIMKNAAAILAFFVVGAFFITPFAELLHRVIFVWENGDMQIVEGSLRTDVELYQRLIRTEKAIVDLAARLILAIGSVYVILNIKSVIGNIKKYINAFLPLIVFGAFSAAIYILSQIRGLSELDIIGSYYRGESIYMFMSYPFVYFFSGMLIMKSKYKKILLYMLMAASIPVNLLTIIDEYFTDVVYYIGTGCSAVFHQHNHYGYYIAVVTVASGLMFVYEEKKTLKILSALSFLCSSSVMVADDTLGAYLAILFTLFLFVGYAFKFEREKLKAAIGVFAAFIVITLLFSFGKNGLLQSLLQMFFDIGKISTDSDDAGTAGTGRWGIWTATVKYISQKPLYGWGIETLKYEKNLVAAHNEVLSYSVYFGIPVGVLYVAATGITMFRSGKGIKGASALTRVCFFTAVCYLVSSMFGNTMYYTTPFIYCFLGLAYSHCLKEKLPETSKTDNNT